MEQRRILSTHLPFCLLLAAMLFASAPTRCQAQDAPGNIIASDMQLSPERITQISTDMAEYIARVVEVEECIATASLEEMKDLQNRLESIDVQWKAYTQIAQLEITASPILMDMLSNYKVLYTTSTDSLQAQQTRLDAEDTYAQALSFITSLKGEYLKMLSEAERYALLPQTAAQLSEVKAREALVYAQASDHYQKAMSASQLSEAVKEKLPALQQQYIEISKLSDKIKSTVYKSWMQRVKDYVLTFAGVAIILLFFNLIVTKIKVAKQARDAAKKYGKMLNRDEDCPTI